MQRRAPKRFLSSLICLSALSTSGCSTTALVGSPPIVTSDNYGIQSRDERLVDSAAQVPARWWTQFESTKLDSLVETALESNPDLSAARNTLRAARDAALAERGALWPSLALNYSPSRIKLAGNQAGSAPGVQGDGTVISGFQGTPASAGGSAPFNAPVTYTYHTAQVTIEFDPDLFGAARSLYGAAQADARIRKHESDAARLTLESSVVGTALQDAMLRRALTLTEHQRLALDEELRLVEHQLRAGLVESSAVAAKTISVAQADASIANLRRQLAQNQDLLRTLCGLPQDRPVPTFELEEFVLPKHLPSMLPSALVGRRPDIQAMASSLEAAGLRAGSARRARLPALSLTGALGGGAAHFDQMFHNSGTFFDLTAAVLQPIFHGRSLAHRADAARALADAAADQYRASVLRAFQNVADVLHALHADAESMQAADASLSASRKIRQHTERRSVAGDVDRLAVLEATAQTYSAELGASQARASQLADTVALYVALGGEPVTEESGS